MFGLWVAGIGLPLFFLSGEVLLRLLEVVARKHAAEFRRHNPNALAAPGVALVSAKSLWKTPLSEYRPGAHLDVAVSGQRYVVDINSRGFRTKEFAERKPAGTVRVICIGGSTTVAGARNDETYPARLEGELRAKHPAWDVEVLNFGISGTGSDYWLKRQAALFRYEPDVVVQYEGVNDILWRVLPRYAQSHPWRRRLSPGRLFQRIFPLSPDELDDGFAETLDRQARLAQLCGKYHARHVAGSFAGPDYYAAPRDMRAALDEDIRTWTGRSGMLLSGYTAYASLLHRYNTLFENRSSAGKLSGVLVHRTLTEPHLFVDICHLTDEGIGRLASAFVPAVSAAIEDALTTGTAAYRYSDFATESIAVASLDDRNLAGSWSPPRRPRDQSTFRWAMPPTSCISFVLQRVQDMRVEVTARAPRPCQPQTMDVLVNGERAGSSQIPELWASSAFSVPRSMLIAGKNDLCMRFANAGGDDGDSVAAAVSEVRLQPQARR